MKPIEWTLVELETTGLVTAQAGRHDTRFRALTETAALAVTSAAAHLLGRRVRVHQRTGDESPKERRTDMHDILVRALCSYSSSDQQIMGRGCLVILTSSVPCRPPLVGFFGKKIQAVRFWYVLLGAVWKVASHTRARERAHFRGNVTILISSTF